MKVLGQPKVVGIYLLFFVVGTTGVLLRNPHKYTYTPVLGSKSWSTTEGFRWGDTRKRGIKSIKNGLCDENLPVENGLEESKKMPLILKRVRDTDGMKIRTKDTII